MKEYFELIINDDKHTHMTYCVGRSNIKGFAARHFIVFVELFFLTLFLRGVDDSRKRIAFSNNQRGLCSLLHMGSW